MQKETYLQRSRQHRCVAVKPRMLLMRRSSDIYCSCPRACGWLRERTASVTGLAGAHPVGVSLPKLLTALHGLSQVSRALLSDSVSSLVSQMYGSS